MLGKLVEFALTQRLLVAVATLLLLGFGSLAYRDLPIDAFPDVSPVQVKIIIKAPGMTPEEVETRIAAPIELEMLGIPSQNMLRSSSKYALAEITLNFNDGTDIYWARQQVAERLSNAQLPANSSGGLAPITTPLSDMYMFTVEGDNYTLQERRTVLDWLIRPALRTLPGVADVNTIGGLVRTFEVVPDQHAMSAQGITFAMLQQALQSNNRNDGAGRLNEGDEALLVRIEGSIHSLEVLRNIVIHSVGGNPVLVSDVAQVRIGSLTRLGVVTKDGKGEAVEGIVVGLRGANAQKLVAAVKQKLQEIAPALPPGLSIKVFYDRSSLVARATGAVTQAIIESVVLVVLLLVLFLGNLRGALVVAITLPFAMLSTFLLMQQFGLSANLMSLGGLTIALGMLVDAAVVVVENIEAHLAQDKHIETTGYLQIVFRAVKEVITPVAAGVAIIIIVFLPLLTLQGLEGKLFVPVALCIVFALASALLLSLTVVPVLASVLLRRTSHQPPWLVRGAMKLYAPLLQRALNRERAVFLGAFLMLLLCCALYPLIGKTFMPEMDEGDIVVGIEKLPSVSLEHSAALDSKIQQALLSQVPEVQGIVARAGSDEIGLDPMGLNQTDSFLVLKPMAQWRVQSKQWLLGDLRKVLEQMPGISYSFSQPIAMRVSEMLTGARGDVAVKIFGSDLEKLDQIAEQIVTVLKGIKGSQDVYTTENSGVQYYRVAIDRLAAGRLGFNVDDIGNMLRIQVEGQQLGVVLEEGRRTPLMLRGPEQIQSSPARFAALSLPLPNGQSVPLSAIAKLQRVDGPVRVERENGQRLVLVRSNVHERDLVGFVDQARLAVAAQVKLPAGYHLSWGGEFENQQRAAARLAMVIPVALGLIFMLLFATFGSVRQALLVLSNIPFALIGGVLALWASGAYLSVPASVGFIALLGIAVLNGVVMVSCFNQLHAEGLELLQVVQEGAQRRLRPVLMTASITAFGLLPLLFASGPGSEIQKPLAIVVIGGLVSSTLLTLIMLPILYRRFGH